MKFHCPYCTSDEFDHLIDLRRHVESKHTPEQITDFKEQSIYREAYVTTIRDATLKSPERNKRRKLSQRQKNLAVQLFSATDNLNTIARKLLRADEKVDHDDLNYLRDQLIDSLILLRHVVEAT